MSLFLYELVFKKIKINKQIFTERVRIDRVRYVRVKNDSKPFKNNTLKKLSIEQN